VGERVIPLKRNPRRTVELRPSPAPAVPARVVKRYHHPGAIARLFDPSRAREELRILRELVARGVPVPRPIEVRSAEGASELVTEWIEDAVPLDALVRAEASVAASPERVTRRAAETLARAHVAGLAHRDLHPGNLVVQTTGAVWLVDLRGARLEAGFDARTARRDLVSLASSVRESVGARPRTRFLAAYLRALPPEARERLPGLASLAFEVELAARLHRREAVRRARKRWTRDSSACRRIVRGEFRGFASVEADERDPVPATGDRHLVLRDRPWRELIRAWYTAARLDAHGIPCARPWALARAPESLAAFALPPDARGDDPPADTGQRAGILRALADRALAFDRDLGPEIRVDAGGRGWLLPLPHARLLDADVEGPAS
jgi:tRNA A-37 threonylcarbamoyl transferase component Bud32